MTESEPSLRIVLFSGGTACRNINIALSRMSASLTRIVPSWDSGGSSKILREAFDMLPVGDIRQALMTMAHGEGRAGDVVKICNSRLSDTLGRIGALTEFDYFASGEHPLLKGMNAKMRDPIMDYLGVFRSNLSDFDFRNGSIGNFIMTGAYLVHDRDIDRAIAEFRDLCGISGQVWPVSVQDDIHLAATLKDGRKLDRQHLVTKMGPADSEVGISEIRLVTGAGDRPALNPIVGNALEAADVIVFGPGSFYTSILPHLLVGDLAERLVRLTHVPRVFVGNILECPETTGMTLDAMVQRFEQAGVDGRMLTHVLSNAELFPFEKKVGSHSYLRLGKTEQLCNELGLEHSSQYLEDAWTRGTHDGRAVARFLTELPA